MRRVLVVETASPKRVRRRIGDLLATCGEPATDIVVLCRFDPKSVAYYELVRGLRVVPLDPDHRRDILRELRSRRFDELHLFWTGELEYRRMKLAALRFRAAVVWVDAGDGNIFRLTWKAWVRFPLFRLRHPLPSDHYEFVAPRQSSEPVEYYEGERVLLIQSAAPGHVLRALETMKSGNLFRDARFSVFCRNRPEIVKHFEGHPLVHEIRTHSETRGCWRHLRDLRRGRFDAAVVFFTGDPSYWKIKYFAFLLGVRHKLIFNENGDCFFFSLGNWLALLSHRLGERSRSGLQPRWTLQLKMLSFLIAKVLVFPLRFAWLLLVWLRLRIAG